VLLQLVVDLLLHPLVVVITAALGEAKATALEMSDVPRFDVKINTVFLKSTVRPWPSGAAVLEHLQQAVVDSWCAFSICRTRPR